MDIYEVVVVENIRKEYVVTVQAVDEDDAADKAYDKHTATQADQTLDTFIGDVTFIRRVGTSDEVMHYE